MISKKLAEVLGVNVGETVRVEVLQDKRPVADVTVVDLIDDIAGLNAYMSIDAVNRMMREGPRINVVMLSADPVHADRRSIASSRRCRRWPALRSAQASVEASKTRPART